MPAESRTNERERGRERCTVIDSTRASDGEKETDPPPKERTRNRAHRTKEDAVSTSSIGGKPGRREDAKFVERLRETGGSKHPMGATKRDVWPYATLVGRGAYALRRRN